MCNKSQKLHKDGATTESFFGTLFERTTKVIGTKLSEIKPALNNQFRSISTAIVYFCAPQLAQFFLKKITEENKKPSVSSQTIIYVINFSGLLFKLHTASGSLIFCFKLDLLVDIPFVLILGACGRLFLFFWS